MKNIAETVSEMVQEVRDDKDEVKKDGYIIFYEEDSHAWYFTDKDDEVIASFVEADEDDIEQEHGSVDVESIKDDEEAKWVEAFLNEVDKDAAPNWLYHYQVDKDGVYKINRYYDYDHKVEPMGWVPSPEASELTESKEVEVKTIDASLLDIYLRLHNSSRYKVSKATNVEPSTFQRAANGKYENISTRIYLLIASALEKDVTKVFSEINKLNGELKLMQKSLAEDADIVYHTHSYITFRSSGSVMTNEEYTKDEINSDVINWLNMDDEDKDMYDDKFGKYVEDMFESDDEPYRSDEFGNKIMEEY